MNSILNYFKNNDWYFIRPFSFTVNVAKRPAGHPREGHRFAVHERIMAGGDLDAVYPYRFMSSAAQRIHASLCPPIPGSLREIQIDGNWAQTHR